ncbi:MAG TPA: hypothetical protein VGA95_01640 [Thermodesulfobacteriota bacterium]
MRSSTRRYRQGLHRILFSRWNAETRGKFIIAKDDGGVRTASRKTAVAVSFEKAWGTNKIQALYGVVPLQGTM